MVRELRRKAVIVGIAQSGFSKNIGRSERSLAVEAVRDALAGA